MNFTENYCTNMRNGLKWLCTQGYEDTVRWIFGTFLPVRTYCNWTLATGTCGRKAAAQWHIQIPTSTNKFLIHSEMSQNSTTYFIQHSKEQRRSQVPVLQQLGPSLLGIQTAVLLMHMLMDPVCKELLRCCLNPNTTASSISPSYRKYTLWRLFIFKSKICQLHDSKSRVHAGYLNTFHCMAFSGSCTPCATCWQALSSGRIISSVSLSWYVDLTW
jgi:hypothetical protein